ncbi:uncharacterized protein [Dermacentor andersoni]|uniref:uncharacterized protein n=1 Tax=Dermacentor andersoni TaxID=34620 RepID=UPI003B3B07CF
MAAEDVTDYPKLKQTLLQRFRYTEEGYRQKFRETKPENSETGRQFAGRLLGYFDHWQQMAKTEKTYDALRDKIVSEQFLLRCDERLAIFLKERGCRGLDKLAVAADHYLEAQNLTNIARGKERGISKAALQSKNSETEARKGKVECFLCRKQGHRAADCWTRSKGPKSSSCWKSTKHGYNADECPNRNGSNTEASGAITSCDRMPANRNEASPAPTSKYEDKTRPPVKTYGEDICLGLQAQETPTATGYLDDHTVTVLRDSGCNTVVVRRSLVPEKSFTGIMRTVYLLDGSCKQLSEAKVYVDSPFFRGTTLALCMEKPLYDVVLGNIDGVVDPIGFNTPHDSADVSKLHKKSAAEEPVQYQSVSQDKATLRAASTRGPKETKLPVAASNALEVDPQVLEELQRADPTLEGCFSSIGKSTTKRSAKVEYVCIKGILYRHYRSLTRKEVDQLIVPQSLRQFVLKMAHEGVLAGHQGIKRTTDRILEEFYWPGVQAEVTRYVRSCDICQRTVPKHLVGRVPLGNMPVIDTPFQRVAIDIIGPLSPTSAKGNRYILTMVDCATRYPDAVALPSIETERVAEALVEMFSRVGIPRDIVSDRGRSFTSSVMRELSRLLPFRHLPTTPYHPMANGLVERFNGTVKQMIRRMCQESPKNWDRYLAPLLFAYREVPQSSLGFSPFDLLYGRYIRGPMAILKELWTQTTLDEETKTTYGYVMELSERLQETCRIAHEELRKAKLTQKKYCDRKAKSRQLCAGDKVLLLLPSDNNKLILTWKGPFTVVEKRSEIDYVVDLGNRTSLFHINLLKKYEERPLSTDTAGRAAVTLQKEQLEEDPELPFLSLHQRETYRDVKVADTLDINQKTRVEQILSNYQDIFSDVPGKTNLVACKLTTTATEPVNVRQYPIPFAVQQAVEEEVQQMLAQGIIEPSDSPYHSPVVVVKKKDGSMRLCIDFRQLNKVVVMDNEPIPRVDMMFANLGKARYFSKFDFTKGYWQCHEGVLHPVAYASRKLLPRETRYSTVEREGLALVWAIQKFHVYLFGKQFVLQSDHQPLAYISSAKHTNSRILRWSLILMEYDFTVEYIKGSENVSADYMNRV